MNDAIARNKYLPKVIPYIGSEIIKVITGQRRVGKSYFLNQLKWYLKKENPELNIIYINKELFDFSFINIASELVDYVEEKAALKNNVLFVDEIQEIKEFEKAIRHFYAKGFDIYISGSNSEMLSGELATMLSGRYIQIRINPLNFVEFCLFHKLETNKKSLDLYLRYGGMPYLRNIPLNDETVFTYLKNIYQTILLKDVVARYNIKNIDFLERLVLFLSDNLGSIVSAKKISDFLKSQHLKISNSVVINYLLFIHNAYFVNKTKRYDLRGKRFLEIGEKYYFTDTGIRNALVGFKAQDINKILENIVYSQLISMGYAVSVGKYYDYEIDFIAQKTNKIVYIQVAYLLSDDKVIKREFGNLQRIKDNYSKFVISMDELQFDSQNGIQHLKLLDFLLMEQF